MLILKKTGGIGMPIEAALTLTDATRKALIKLADDTDGTSEMLSGHGAHPHCAFIALPFVGYPHATGNLMGVAVVLPRNIDAASRRAVLKTCALLEKINLVEVLGDWSVELANFDNPAANFASRNLDKARQYLDHDNPDPSGPLPQEKSQRGRNYRHSLRTRRLATTYESRALALLRACRCSVRT